MKGFIVDAEFLWGFQAGVVGLSKSPPSFYYPPPTTILGSLAESVSRRESLGEKNGLKLIERLSENLLGIGIKPLNCTPLRFQDINRIVTIKITRGKWYPRPDHLAGSFDSPARGKTILASLDGEAPTLRIFVVLKEDKIELDKKIIVISRDDFWRIHRLGSKESRVSVKEVEEFTPEIINGRIKTQYSFPLDFAKPLEDVDSWIYETYLDPFNVKYEKGKNPVKDYLLQKNVKVFSVPIFRLKLTSVPSRLVETKMAYKYNDEILVGKS